MRKASAKATLHNLMDWLDTYESIFLSVSKCPIEHLTHDHKIEMVEAIAIRICTIWHFSMEDLLVDCLNRDSTKYAEFMSAPRLAKHIPRVQCEFMLNGTGYFDTKSVSDLKSKAKSVLVDTYNPFKAISKKDAEKIDELFTIRNYLSHYSRVSKRKLDFIYRKKYRLKKLPAPGYFLSATDSATKAARLFSYVNTMRSATSAMADALMITL